MSARPRQRRCAVIGRLVGLWAFLGSVVAIAQIDTHDVPQAFVGATIIDGTGREAIHDAVLVVLDGRVSAIGPASSTPIPAEAERISLAGAYVIPGLVNVHGHVGIADGLNGDEASAHTRENVLEQLALYARYGITTVISLGDPGTYTLPLRNEQTPSGLTRARLLSSGPVIAPSSPQAAEQDVSRLAAMGVDWVKIRVDDSLGRSSKMAPEVYAAVIRSAHERGLPVAAHIVDLEDAKGLLQHGVDLLAHSVRDRPVDAELIELMGVRNACLSPTFTRELSVFIYADRPSFFDDPFLLSQADPRVLDGLQAPERQANVRNSASARFFRDALPLAQQNMMALHEHGVGIAMGTDSGPVGRFQGYFEHLELEMMQEAGMSPHDVLRAATGRAAECAGLTDVGTLEPGKWADFIVLEEDPLADIRASRTIREVRIAGNAVR